jgi:hypothetical protein
MSSLAERIGAKRRKFAAAEILIFVGSLLSLVVSCILWSARKQPWVDEIYTWIEVRDPSLFHLYRAIEHGADGGMPLFYTTAWLWARLTGTTTLGLRFYSCAAICGALAVLWFTLRRAYGFRSSAFGLLMVWGTSSLLLDQNAEARFYGLYLLTFAVAVSVYLRMTERKEPGTRLLIWGLLSQAALVSSHVFGILYGGSLLCALAVSDIRKGWVRPKVYCMCAAGWVALVPWAPAIRASIAAGKPRSWIMPPQLADLPAAYALEMGRVPCTWLHKRWPAFPQSAWHLPLLLSTSALAIAAWKLATARPGETGDDAADDRSALLLAAFSAAAVTLVLFVLSRVVTPVFVARYRLPWAVGLSIVLAAFADTVGLDRIRRSSLAGAACTGLLCALLCAPILSALAVEYPFVNSESLDVARLDALIPPNGVVVTGWQHDLFRTIRFSTRADHPYYYLLDWPTALRGPSEFITDYHLMRAYREAGYNARSIQDQEAFFCEHPNFYALDNPEYSWFDVTVRTMPEFQWTKVISATPGFRRNLYRVHRIAPLPFCPKH